MSSSFDHYNAKLGVITAIPEIEAKSPNMPVDEYLEEAEFLYKWSLRDEAALTGAGLDWDLVVDLPVRTGALREAEAIWFRERFDQDESGKTWKEASEEGYDFRDVLLHTFRHAYRDDPAVLRRVASIAEGYGHADMIQDLKNLAGLGRANIEPILKIRYDAADLDRAAILSDELADMQASAQVDREDNGSSRVIRDQAYTHLKQAMDEIRASGRYVFWRNEERYQGYVSQYNKKHNSKSRNTPAEELAEALATEEAV